MSQITTEYTPSKKVYALVFDSSTMQVFKPSTDTFVDFVQGDWADYAIDMIETAISTGASAYVCTFPDVVDGQYIVMAYSCEIGETAASTHTLVAVGEENVSAATSATIQVTADKILRVLQSMAGGSN